MSVDFLAIDFETANSFRGSPCSVGIAEVRGGQIVSRRAELICPVGVSGPEDFDAVNVAIHGITWDMVAKRPSFSEVWESLELHKVDIPLVAHYAAFDLGVIREAFNDEGLEWPSLSYTCTVVLSRKVLDLPSYSLPFVADSLGVGLRDHHDAGADASACAEIMLGLLEKTGAGTLNEMLNLLGVRWGILSPNDWSGSLSRGSRRGSGVLSRSSLLRSLAAQRVPCLGFSDSRRIFGAETTSFEEESDAGVMASRVHCRLGTVGKVTRHRTRVRALHQYFDLK